MNHYKITLCLQTLLRQQKKNSKHFKKQNSIRTNFSNEKGIFSLFKKEEKLLKKGIQVGF